MKKIDFHIHTISTDSDYDFEYSPDYLINYVKNRNLDCIAITNHNTFNLQQYTDISKNIDAVVFPGIEIDLEGGHLLLIADKVELSDFESKCRIISQKIPTKNDSITTEELTEIFPDLSKYILIPHYDKKPPIKNKTLEKLDGFITCGEVTSPKKFLYCIRNQSALVPVYFSDLRSRSDTDWYPARQTYLDVGEITIPSIKHALRDKNKVFLSEKDGHKFFDAFDNGLRLSTGLNVVLGERSTGKSYTLDRIEEEYENIKYLKQFALLERDNEKDRQKFNETLSRGQSLYTQEYLREFQEVVLDMSNVNAADSNYRLKRYLETLLKNAEESEKADAYSKAILFSESKFSEDGLDNLKSLVESVKRLIENNQYREIIDNFVTLESLKKLIVALMTEYSITCEANLKKRFVNDLISFVKSDLQIHTAATPIEAIDLYELALEQEKIKKFCDLVRSIKEKKYINNKEIQGYQVVAEKRPFSGAQELKSMSGRMLSFSGAFDSYDNPYDYLVLLRKIEGLEESAHYKYFVYIEYLILNEHGYKVSGGERSEFRLLQEISDAQQYDMLLIDEPESSFDNVFLINKVNRLIKEISKTMPVIVVTHNSTVGASIKPDYIIHTKKEIEGNSVVYKVYSGHPSDKFLRDLNGAKVRNFEVLINCLEAGKPAYDERGSGYEILEN